MKKTLAFCTLLFIFIQLHSQVKIGVKGGYNYATAKAVYAGVKQSTNFISGFGVGAMAKIPFDGVLHFSPSVMVNSRGFTVKPTAATNSKEQYNITYLDFIPALSAEFENDGNAVSLGIGPVLGFTNFGKLKATNAITNITNTQKLKFGYGGYGWFDLGFTATIGYRVKKLLVEANYYSGLTSINNNEETDGRNIHNRVISLNLGYYFKQKG